MASGHSYNLRPRSKDGRAAGSRAECAVVEEDTTPTASRSGRKPRTTQVEETPLSELKLPLKLKWRQVSDMPITLNYHPSAVVMKGDVYFGGGLEMPMSKKDAKIVCIYNPLSDSWSQLPPYRFIDFRLAVINENQLVAIGGEKTAKTKMVTNKLGVWDDKQRKWVFSLPAMNTACSSPAVATYNQWLLVAGGYGEQGGCLSRVEVMNVSSKQWYQVGSLPFGWNRMTSTMIGNTWYLMGGWAKFKPRSLVMSVSVEDIISEATSQQPAGTNSSTLSRWNTLPDTPLILSTALGFQGALLAIGGGSGSSPSSEIYLYQPSTSKWIKVGDMPTKRSLPACTVLPNGHIIVSTGCILGEDGVEIVQVL